MATIAPDTELKPIGEGFGERRFIGFEIETTRNEKALTEENMGYKAFREIIDPHEKVVAMIGSDGDDIEIATQPIEADMMLWSGDLDTTLKRINRYCLPCEASGTHMHVSVLPTDKKNLWRNLYWFSVVYDKQLYEIFRRRSHWARSPKELWEAKRGHGAKLSIDDVKNARYPIQGYKGTIIIKREKTYECRGGSASTSPIEIRAWGKLFLNIVEFCNQSNIVGHRFEEVIPAGDLGEVIKQRLNGEQLRQIVPNYIYL